MLSIVVPHYAHYGVLPLANLGVHQFQDGQWVVVDRGTLPNGFVVAPSLIDLRGP